MTEEQITPEAADFFDEAAAENTETIETAVEEETKADEIGEETSNEMNNTDELLSEIQRLKKLLEDKEKEQARIISELGEFNRLFPDIAVKNVPDAVWQRVEGGIPLCAAYALYEKEESLLNYRANEINSKNALASAGRAGKSPSTEYFSPDEVKAMSQKEVHENYSKIKNSMKYWR